jgi:hypothetical protein
MVFFIDKNWGDVVIFAHHESLGGDNPNGVKSTRFS